MDTIYVDMRTASKKDTKIVLVILEKHFTRYHNPNTFFEHTRKYGVLQATTGTPSSSTKKSYFDSKNKKLWTCQYFISRYTKTKLSFKGLQWN